MITRYEMWRYIPGVEVDRPTLAHNLNYNLKALVGAAQGLASAQLILSNGKSNHDIMFVMTFDSEQDLSVFEQDAAYEVFTGVYIDPYFEKRAAVDMED